LFEEECIPTQVDKGRRDRRMLLLDGDHAVSSRNLRGGGAGQGARRRLSDSSSSNSRGWSRSRRRLEEVITGLDSEPMDFPDRGRGEFSLRCQIIFFFGFTKAQHFWLVSLFT
jgi:hypothetical protein